MSTTSSTGTQAVDRAARVIATVVEADQPLLSHAIAEECGLPRSTTSRLLAALERTDLLERTSAGGFVAGPLFWLYASRHDPWEELGHLARPGLEAVVEAIGETVHFGVPRNNRVAHVSQVDSRYLLGTRDWTDEDVPAHASALGKVLYAHGALALPATSLPQLTPATVTSPDTLARQLRQVLRDGYAVAKDELELGLTAVAAPVFGSGTDVFGALGVSGPTSRIEHRIEEIGRLLVEQAEQLSMTLRRGTRKEGVA